MHPDDPEQYVADLERQLAERRIAGANQASRQGATAGGRLTPDQVRNVAFGKPPIGKRGYNEDEVDAFLDRVAEQLNSQRGPLPPPSDGSAVAMGDRLTPEQVRDFAFSKRPRGEPGYDEAEVDAFLDRVEAALRDPARRTLTAEQVGDVTFSRRRIGKRGYDEAEVDAFLDRVAEQLKFQPGGSPPPPRAASGQFTAFSTVLSRKFLITVTPDGLTVDRRHGDVYSFADAELGPWVMMGAALHLQCGRHRFWLGGKDRRIGPATRLDALPTWRVDAWLGASDFDELLRCMGGRWGEEARGPGPGEPTRCLLFANPDLIHRIGPFAFRKKRRYLRSLSQPQPQLIIDVDNDTMRVIDPNGAAPPASAPLSQVSATPAVYELKPRHWWEAGDNPVVNYTKPAVNVSLPGVPPLSIEVFEERYSWHDDNVPVTHEPPPYVVSPTDWLLLIEKCGLAAHLKDRTYPARG